MVTESGSRPANVLSPSSLSLLGRHVLVTGAGAGLGRATALALARFGADLAVCDRARPGLEALLGEIAEIGRRGYGQVLDVRDPVAVGGFVAAAARSLGPLHGLVNNAGGTFRADFEAVSEKGQQALIEENFSSATHTIRAALPHFAEEGGAIVNITSIEASRAGPGFAVYSAMKAALENLGKSLALELGGRNIRVNAVAPDAIPTEGTGDFALATPIPRRGEPDDVAGAVVFLVSDLGRFITGTTLHVDGGALAAGGWRRVAGSKFEL